MMGSTHKKKDQYRLRVVDVDGCGSCDIFKGFSEIVLGFGWPVRVKAWRSSTASFYDNRHRIAVLVYIYLLSISQYIYLQRALRAGL